MFFSSSKRKPNHFRFGKEVWCEPNIFHLTRNEAAFLLLLLFLLNLFKFHTWNSCSSGIHYFIFIFPMTNHWIYSSRAHCQCNIMSHNTCSESFTPKKGSIDVHGSLYSLRLRCFCLAELFVCCHGWWKHAWIEEEIFCFDRFSCAQRYGSLNWTKCSLFSRSC